MIEQQLVVVDVVIGVLLLVDDVPIILAQQSLAHLSCIIAALVDTEVAADLTDRATSRHASRGPHFRRISPHVCFLASILVLLNLLSIAGELEQFLVFLHRVEDGAVRIHLVLLFVCPALQELKKDFLEFVELVVELRPLADDFELFAGLYLRIVKCAVCALLLVALPYPLQ